VGSQATAALPVLALCPEQRPEHKRGEQAHQRIDEITDRKGMKERHFDRASIRKMPATANKRETG
jgi:hypothetical protein